MSEGQKNVRNFVLAVLFSVASVWLGLEFKAMTDRVPDRGNLIAWAMIWGPVAFWVCKLGKFGLSQRVHKFVDRHPVLEGLRTDGEQH